MANENSVARKAWRSLLIPVVGSAASTYTQFVSTTDTIDCLIAGAAPATGRLRVYATLIDCNESGAEATAAARDALA